VEIWRLKYQRGYF